MNHERPEHSVAFRVTRSEWLRLCEIAGDKKMSVGAFAKDIIFQHVGLGTAARRIGRPAKGPK